MTTNLTVSVILPAHNEALNVEAVIWRCVSVCSDLFNDFEVLVVDDGSSDGTGELVASISRVEHRVKLISHPINRGYGAALRSGFKAAAMEWIFFTDADGQFDVGEMGDFVGLLGSADIVAGNRIRRMDNFYRRLMGWIYTILMDTFFGVGIKDINCAFKFIRADALKGFTLISEGALINTEIIALARRNNMRIVQKGVHHYPRQKGRQSGGSARVIFRAIKEFLRLFLQFRGHNT